MNTTWLVFYVQVTELDALI